MRRLTDVIPLSILLIVIALAITLLIDNFIELPLISLQTLTNVITVISSTVLFAIGLKLYKKFSSTQAILDKQTVTVIELMRLLSNARFKVVQIRENGKRGNALMNLKIHDYESHINHINDVVPGTKFNFKSTDQYFSIETVNFIEKTDILRGDVYLPSQIAKQLEISFNLPVQASIARDAVKGAYLEFGPMDGEDTDRLLWKSGDIIAVMKSMKAVYDQADSWLKRNNPEIYDTLNIT